MTHSPRILFTAFEPSGDALAAAVIGRLKHLQPDLDIWALGGLRMQEQGAQLIERTTDRAEMFLGALSQANVHLRRVKQLERWLKQHPIQLLVPVDSPAANWSICRLVRKLQQQAGIVHLAAPQLWAWAPWRIRKLRRLTDHVLCLLPFEPRWFTQRGVEASFVGHPIFDNVTENRLAAANSDESNVTLALLPGSRLSEIRANWPTMLQAAVKLRTTHRNLRGLVAAVDESATTEINDFTLRILNGKPWPDWLTIKVNQADRVLAQSDLVLVVSGTATLLVTAHRKPMVVIYHVNPWVWHLAGRWLMRTPSFALPNLISQAMGLGRAVPELVPHFGSVAPVVEELNRLLVNKDLCRQQMEAFDRIAASFDGHSFRDLAAKRCLLRIEQST